MTPTFDPTSAILSETTDGAQILVSKYLDGQETRFVDSAGNRYDHDVIFNVLVPAVDPKAGNVDGDPSPLHDGSAEPLPAPVDEEAAAEAELAALEAEAEAEGIAEAEAAAEAETALALQAEAEAEQPDFGELEAGQES